MDFRNSSSVLFTCPRVGLSTRAPWLWSRIQIFSFAQTPQLKDEFLFLGLVKRLNYSVPTGKTISIFADRSYLDRCFDKIRSHRGGSSNHWQSQLLLQLRPESLMTRLFQALLTIFRWTFDPICFNSRNNTLSACDVTSSFRVGPRVGSWVFYMVGVVISYRLVGRASSSSLARLTVTMTSSDYPNPLLSRASRRPLLSSLSLPVRSVPGCSLWECCLIR